MRSRYPLILVGVYCLPSPGRSVSEARLRWSRKPHPCRASSFVDSPGPLFKASLCVCTLLPHNTWRRVFFSYAVLPHRTGGIGKERHLPPRWCILALGFPTLPAGPVRGTEPHYGESRGLLNILTFRLPSGIVRLWTSMNSVNGW